MKNDEGDSTTRSEREAELTAERAAQGSDASLHPSVGSDWSYCEVTLAKVSRSFVLPIAALTGDLRQAITCGYLLCRVVDTIEDHEGFDADARRRLFSNWMEIMAAATAGRTRPVLCLPGTTSDADVDDRALCANVDRVFAVLDSLPQSMRAPVIACVVEMSHGMRLYSERAAANGVRALKDMSDLHRYCYFVAGTVGQMLTELFLSELKRRQTPAKDSDAKLLREHSDAFGRGLQLVNILKDVADDRARGWSYIPRTVLDIHRMSGRPSQLPEDFVEAHQALSPIFDEARSALSRAVDYVCALPSGATDMRQFCLIPLGMAIETLNLAEGNDDIFVADAPMKISRGTVATVLRTCHEVAASSSAIRRSFQPSHTVVQPT